MNTYEVILLIDKSRQRGYDASKYVYYYGVHVVKAHITVHNYSYTIINHVDIKRKKIMYNGFKLWK